MRTYHELFAVREFAVHAAVPASMSMSSLGIGTITYARTGSAVLTDRSMFGGP